MALSHYRYYGRALKAVGEIDDRLTIDQLHLVALGSLLHSWNVPRKGIESAAKWLNALEGCLSRTKKSLGCPRWMAILAKAARDVLDVDSPRRKEALALVHFGQRRGSNLLLPRRQTCLPWFGLRFSHIAEALAAETPIECAVQYLRSIARAGSLGHDDALITCITTTDLSKKRSETRHQYFTANIVNSIRVDTPVADAKDIPDLENDDGQITPAGKGKKTSDDGIRRDQELPAKNPRLSRHVSWNGTFMSRAGCRSRKETFTHPKRHRSRRGIAVDDQRESLMEVPEDEMGTHTATSNNSCGDVESAFLVPPDDITNIFSGHGVIGEFLPVSLQYEERSVNGPGDLTGDCYALLPHALGWFSSNPVEFYKFVGEPQGSLRLWIAKGYAVDKPDVFSEKVRSLQSGASVELLDIEVATQLLDEDGGLKPLLVWQYLNGADPYEPEDIVKELLGLMRTERGLFAVTLNTLRNLEVVTNIYNRLDGATISSSIVERGLHDVKWAGPNRHSFITRSMVFSWIAMMETGKISLDAQRLEHVIALSSGNSLFVSTRLLTDPYEDVPESSVTRIVGNVGLPGLNLLIPPAAPPLARSLSTSFRAVTYAPFNGQREDHFKGTTLHLSFTSQKFPLDYGVTGIVDHQVFFVESVISIHDSGQWVADLDTLKAFSIGSEHRLRIPRRQQQKTCTHPEGMLSSILDGITSIDTWEEALDTSPGVNIIRAHRNWPARLAASVMLSKARRSRRESEDLDSEDLDATDSEEGLGHERYSILENGDNVCWVCLHRRLSKTSRMSTSGPFYIIA